MPKIPPFTIGIEEEYLLIDRDSRDLVATPPDHLIEECAALMPGRVAHEFLRSQIEVNTGVCATIAEARADLRRLRRTVADKAAAYNLAPIAAATHPFARWNAQLPTARERYQDLARDLAGVARRLVICGLHVHVGLGEDDDLRVDLMNQVSYFLPHLLALSTSSPFWQGEDTGLKSYRLSVFNSLPRTGLPERFESWGEYQRLVNRMKQAGLITDASKIWWDVRPSTRFPTLEMRVTDVCTRIEDALAIAALYVSLLSMLYRLRTRNQRWRIYSNTLINENRWRAQRYGLDGPMADFGLGEVKPFAGLIEEMIDHVREDAQALGCMAEVEHARTILTRGTSAHAQLATYNAALEAGKTRDEALRAVVDRLATETVAEC